MKIKEFVKSHKKQLVTGAVLLCFWAFVVGILYTKIVDVTYEKDFAITSIAEEDECIQMYAGDVLEQKMDFSLSEIVAITVEIPEEQESVEDLEIQLAVYDQNHALVQQTLLEGKTLVNSAELYMHFDQAVLPGTYYVEISAELSEEPEAELEAEVEQEEAELEAEEAEIEEDTVPVLELYKGEVANDQYAIMNGKVTDTSLAVNERNLSWSHDSYRGLCGFVTVIIAITILLLYFLLFVKKAAFHWCYAVVGVAFGIIFMFIIPPYTTPDEQTHISTALYISNQVLGWDTLDENSAFIARETEVNNGFEAYVSREVYNNYLEKLQMPVTEAASIKYDQMHSLAAPYGMYTIPAIGVTIGRLLNMNGVATILLGTLCNMLFFVAMATYGIKKAPFGKMILAGVCLLPMTLQQISSFSYDNPIIAATIVVMALGLRWCYSEENIQRNELIMYAFSSVILLVGKGGVYFMFIFLPFIYKFSKEKLQLLWNKYRVQTIVFALAAVVIFFRDKIIGFIQGLFAAPAVTETVVESTETLAESAETVAQVGNYITWAGAEGYTVSYLLTHPGELINLLYNTFMENMDWYLGSMLGNSLGWFQISIPWVLLIVMFVVLLLATVKPAKESGELVLMDKLIVGFFAVISMGLCIAAMLLLWTPMGARSILGVQGRYFLPPLVAALFALRNSKLQLSRNIDRELLYTMFVINIVVIYFVLRFSI